MGLLAYLLSVTRATRLFGQSNETVLFVHEIGHAIFTLKNR